MNAKIIYIRNDKNTPVAAIAYQPRADNVIASCAMSGGFLATVAGAWCHPKDNFVKAVARAKAAGRLKSRDQSATIWIGADDISAERGSGAWWSVIESRIAREAAAALKGERL